MSNSIQVLANNFVEDKCDKTFIPLYKRLLPGLRKMSRGFFKDEDVVADVLAETFTKIWIKVDSETAAYDPYYAFSTWAYNICRYECLQTQRKLRRNYSIEKMQEDQIGLAAFQNQYQFEMDPEVIQSEHPDIVNDKLHSLVLLQMETLDEKYKGILTDFLINKLSIRELSSKYGHNENTIKTRIRNAKIKIRKQMKKDYAPLVKEREEALS
jgi:RNA polymerase sigma-70 factor (ECF subfamily)